MELFDKKSLVLSYCGEQEEDLAFELLECLCETTPVPVSELEYELYKMGEDNPLLATLHHIIEQAQLMYPDAGDYKIILTNDVFLDNRALVITIGTQ